MFIINFFKRHKIKVKLTLAFIIGLWALSILIQAAYAFLASIPEYLVTVTENARLEKYNKLKNADVITCGGYILENPKIYHDKVIDDKKVYDFIKCDAINQ